MNPGVHSDHPSIHYYDSDYPSALDVAFPENFDDTTEYQGIAFDVTRYRELVQEFGGPVLEIGCGSGRVAIPLARDGFEVTGVDVSAGMLARFRNALEQENSDVAARIRLVEQDARTLDLPVRNFRTAIIAFNSLLCVTEFDGQCAILSSLARHLEPGAKLVLDVVNPLQLKIQGDPVPKPFFTRKDRNTGNIYTRFAMIGPFDANHRQRLYGWYDEILPDGFVKRSHYSLYWRPIFRFELELMLHQSGFRVISMEGGHRKEKYSAESPWMFTVAEKAR